MKQRIEKIFWTLLRAGLSESDCNLIGYGAVTEAEWQRLFDLSAEQGLTGIVFSAIERLHKSYLPPMDMLMDWLGQAEYIKSCNEDYRQKAGELLEAFRSKGLVPVVLKGEACTRYYPQPDRRALGDLDIYLMEDTGHPRMGGHEWAYEEGNRLATIMGAKVIKHDYKHSHIDWKGLMVENHRLLTTARGSKAKKEFENHLKELLEVGDSANFEALFLTVHMFQHFMEGELTMRQICDWAMFIEKRHAEVDWYAFLIWMERLGMSKFVNAIRYITEKDLAVTTDMGHASAEDEKLARLVLNDTLYDKHKQMSAEHIIRYRIWQTGQIFRSSWKYRVFKNENVLSAYTKMLWAHWFDKV